MPDSSAFQINQTMGINVAIVEDNRSFRDKLANYLNETPGYHCVCACDSAEDALKIIPRLLPDVVLMDIHLPSMSGVDCTRKLKELCPSVQILILRSEEHTSELQSRQYLVCRLLLEK